MLEWLMKKGQNSRIFMCIKEVKWELESHDSLHRATILAIAQLFREQALSEGIPLSAFDNPFSRKRDELMAYYVGIEDIRNLADAKLSETQQGFKRLGVELPSFAIDHAKACSRGLEVWMCTIGVGVVPERRDDVQRIWEYLKGAATQVPAAIARLRDIERKTDDGMFAGVTDEAWAASCNFFPAAFFNRA